MEWRFSQGEWCVDDSSVFHPRRLFKPADAASPNMLIIREDQMRAMAKARREAALAELTEQLMASWPRAVARSGRSASLLIDDALGWATARKMEDSEFILVTAAIIAAFGAPPWRLPWAAPLRDHRLSASAAHAGFMRAARAELLNVEAA